MNLSKAIGDAVIETPKPHSIRWWTTKIVPNATYTVQAALAITIISTHLDTGTLNPAIGTLTSAIDYANINLALSLATAVAVHIGGKLIMPIIEKLLRPLLNAQKEAGIKQGSAKERKHNATIIETWAKEQAAAGVTFASELPNLNDQCNGSQSEQA